VQASVALYTCLALTNPSQAQDESEEGGESENAGQSRPETARGMLEPVDLPPGFRQTGWVDYTVTGVGATAAIVSRLLAPREDGTRGGSWIDEDVRSRIRAPVPVGRFLAEDISDVLLGATTSYALFGDPLINAAWLRDSSEVGVQIAWMNAEVIALTTGVQQTTSRFVGRERPYGRTCGTSELDARTHSCVGRDRYRSFFSGHTSVPFAVATATCVHHAYVPLSGGRGYIPCGLMLAAAAASGTLRIVSDNHYATDVMSGAAVGSLIGLSIPLIHYTTGLRGPEFGFWKNNRMAVLPLFTSEEGRFYSGLSFVGGMR
jgi:membrane-associated phospholipid phosphatase